MTMNYISLFSGAGVGCYGFLLEGFKCIATNEVVERRLNIQKFNNKCKYETGYIYGDITNERVKQQLFDQVKIWEKKENLKRVDVVIATPPCQGMSVANHKKHDKEIIRNSLVIESIKIIREIQPKFFIFENVPAFMKTICTDIDGIDKPISEAISTNLGGLYSYASQIINLKNYGASSSRQRTIVIGVANDYANEISPFELYPSLQNERTLREVIGHLRPLKEFGEIDDDDIYHSFRIYPERMRVWISGLREGQSAFENKDDEKKPHQIKNGKIVINKQKNGDKYRRQYWDKVGPCIHTRNDQLASQNTVHPEDDRVFSIRELMLMMTVPDHFKWVDEDVASLNILSYDKKRKFLKKEEIKIRQSLGEAVPTTIFKEIARNIKSTLIYPPLTNSMAAKIVAENDFSDTATLIRFIEENPMNLSVAGLSRVAELSNTKRTANAAYFTSKSLITEMLKAIPDSDKSCLNILEPSVGVGNFIPLILKKFEGKKLNLDLVDIDNESIQILKALIKKYDVPSHVSINYIIGDFLTCDFRKTYDFIIGNPPFYKMQASDKKLKFYRQNAINKTSTNTCSFFLDKAISIGNYISFVFPKFLLNTPEFEETRNYLYNKSVECIIDFGEKGFPGVLVETIAIFINGKSKPSKTSIISVPKQLTMCQRQKYIFDKSLPYWVIYRNEYFDKVFGTMIFNMFSVFRDRQVTKKLLSKNGDIRVLRSRNISDDGQTILNIKGYDTYIADKEARGLSVYSYLDRDDVYLTPNMTYNPRVMKKPRGVLVNGSIAILIPKFDWELSEAQLLYYSKNEFRNFYQIARNYQTRSLNVDANSVYFFGLVRASKEC